MGTSFHQANSSKLIQSLTVQRSAVHTWNQAVVPGCVDRWVEMLQGGNCVLDNHTKRTDLYFPTIKIKFGGHSNSRSFPGEIAKQ